MKPEIKFGTYLAVYANEGMKPEMQLGLYLAVFFLQEWRRKWSSGCIWLYLALFACVCTCRNEAGKELRLYLAAFANEGMKPEMELGLYLAVFGNEGMEREMLGLYLAVFGCF